MIEQREAGEWFRDCADRVIRVEFRDLLKLAKRHSDAQGALSDAFYRAAEAHYDRRIRRFAVGVYSNPARVFGRDVGEHAEAHLRRSRELLYATRGARESYETLLNRWRDRRLGKGASDVVLPRLSGDGGLDSALDGGTRGR